MLSIRALAMEGMNVNAENSPEHQVCEALVEALDEIADLRKTLKAAIEAYESELWRPIEEAPLNSEGLIIHAQGLDGKMIIGDGLVTDGRWAWSNNGSCDCCWGWIETPPTHFRPLPEPPSD